MLVRKRQQVVALVTLDRLDNVPFRVGVRDLDPAVSPPMSSTPSEPTLFPAWAASTRHGAQLVSAALLPHYNMAIRRRMLPASRPRAAASKGGIFIHAGVLFADSPAEAENGLNSGGERSAEGAEDVALAVATARRRSVDGLNIVGVASGGMGDWKLGGPDYFH